MFSNGSNKALTNGDGRGCNSEIIDLTTDINSGPFEFTMIQVAFVAGCEKTEWNKMDFVYEFLKKFPCFWMTLQCM